MAISLRKRITEVMALNQVAKLLLWGAIAMPVAPPSTAELAAPGCALPRMHPIQPPQKPTIALWSWKNKHFLPGETSSVQLKSQSSGHGCRTPNSTELLEASWGRRIITNGSKRTCVNPMKPRVLKGHGLRTEAILHPGMDRSSSNLLVVLDLS